jgi:hypothetical protein
MHLLWRINLCQSGLLARDKIMAGVAELILSRKQRQLYTEYIRKDSEARLHSFQGSDKQISMPYQLSRP